MSIVDKAKEKYEQYEQQHGRIIQAAIKVFGETNFDAGTMAMIAEEAGLSEAMLYKHFDGKKKLFITCFQEVIGELMVRYRECYRQNEGDPLGYLEDSAIAYLRYIKESMNGPKYFSHLLSNTFDPDLKKPLTEFILASISTVKKALDQAQKKGDLGKGLDTELLAWDYVGQYFSLILAREMDIKHMLDEKRVHLFVRTMFRE